jgi:mannose-6-phosphate isomerase
VRPEPTRIAPIFSPRPWGVRSLAPLFPEKTNLSEPLGEAWLTSVDSQIATGPYAGKTLGSAWREMPAEWRGTQLAGYNDFPILVKFLFPNEKLSIQVHPGDDYAAVHEQAAGGRGKTEMWHAISAEPGAQLFLGFRPGVNKEQFLNALAQNTLENLLEAHPVHAGDTFFVPPGTPHTIGPGMILCEVQEYSDLTYRVYDYGRVDAQGRPRELHIYKALEVLQFGYAKGGKISPATLSATDPHAKLLCACPYFAAERLEFSDRCEFPADPEHFQLLIIIQGRGNFGWPSSAARYHTGECWLLPASLDLTALHPLQPTTLLRTYVPDIAALRKRLHDAGISASAISQSFFA